MFFTTRTRPETRVTTTRQSLTLFNFYAGSRIPYDTILVATGFVFVNFAQSLGIKGEMIGYFASVASFACVLQIVGLLVANRIADKKQFTIRFSYLEPFWMMAAVISALFLPAPLRFPCLAIGLVLSASSIHLIKPTLDEWLASAIPQSVRGRYLSRRFQVISVISIIIVPVSGWIAKTIGKHNSMGLAILLLAGGLFGLLAAHLLRGIAMPRISAGARLSWSAVPEVLRHWPLLRYTTANMIYNLPFFVACPYYQVYNINVLKMNEFTISIMMTGYYIIKVVLFQFAGRWVDRIGPRATIYLVSPLYLIFFALYAVSGQGNAWIMFIGWALAGIADAGFAVASTTALYGSVPETSTRQAYFAFYNLIAFLLTGIGAAGAARAVKALEDVRLHVGPIDISQYQILFATSVLLLIPCILGTCLFPGKRETARQRDGGTHVSSDAAAISE